MKPLHAHSLRALALAAILSVGFSRAEAASCANLRYTEEESKNLKGLKENAEGMLAKGAQNGHPRAVAFLIVGPDKKTKSTHLVPIPSENNRAALPAELLLAHSPGDKIYAFQSAASSEYIFPGSEETMGKTPFKPSLVCPSANKEDRFIPGPAEGDASTGAMSCQIVNLSGLKEATLVYDQVAKTCTEIVALVANKNRSDDEELRLMRAMKELQTQFGSTAKVGPNRSPAIDSQATQVLPKDAPKQKIGTSKELEESQAKKASGTQIP